MLCLNLSRHHLYPFFQPEAGTGVADVCEVGVQDGYNAERIWRALAPRSLHLVDIWDAHAQVRHDGSVMTETENERLSRSYMEAAYGRTRDRFAAQIAAGSVELVKAPSVEAATRFPDGSFDLVYIDALHTFEGCYADLKAWAPKVKPDGVLAGHDLFHVGVNDALLRFMQEEGWHFIAFTKESSPTYILHRDRLSGSAVELRRRFYEAGIVEFRIEGDHVPNGRFEVSYVAGRRYTNSVRLTLRPVVPA